MRRNNHAFAFMAATKKHRQLHISRWRRNCQIEPTSAEGQDVAHAGLLRLLEDLQDLGFGEVGAAEVVAKAGDAQGEEVRLNQEARSWVGMNGVCVCVFAKFI